MPLHSWEIKLKDPDGNEIEVSAEAITEDGALSSAMTQYKESYGRWPHEAEYVQVKEISQRQDVA